MSTGKDFNLVQWLHETPETREQVVRTFFVFLITGFFIILATLLIYGGLGIGWEGIASKPWITININIDDPEICKMLEDNRPEKSPWWLLIEEVVARLLVLSVCVLFSSKICEWLRLGEDTTRKTVALIAIGSSVVSSAIFGFVHGGATNIPIQGLSGLWCSFCFLKMGGLKKEFAWGLVCSFALHVALNEYFRMAMWYWWVVVLSKS